MNRLEKLEWLARNVHEWKHGHGLCVVNPGVGETYATWPSICIPSGSTFTKADWLSMREKLQNKPSWKDAPEWAEYMAQSEISGFWEFFSGKPEPSDKGYWKHAHLGFIGAGTPNKGEVLGDWRDTLEKRPEMPSKTNIARELEDVPKIDFSAGGKIDDRRQEWQNNHEVEELIVTIKNNFENSTNVVRKTGQNEMTVTKQQQLEWLANKITKWPDDMGVILVSLDHLGNPKLSECWDEAQVAITHGEWKRERDKMQKQESPDNSWHERGELPPVGGECSAMCDGKWVTVEVLRHRVNNVGMNVAAVMNCTSFNVFWATDFRPLRTEREKAIDALIDIICAGGYFTRRDGAAREIAERIHDAGMLKQ